MGYAIVVKALRVFSNLKCVSGLAVFDFVRSASGNFSAGTEAARSHGDSLRIAFHFEKKTPRLRKSFVHPDNSLNLISRSLFPFSRVRWRLYLAQGRWTTPQSPS